MRKLIYTIVLFILTSIFCNLANASDSELEDIIWGYKKTQTISIDEYLRCEKTSNKNISLKLNESGDVTYKGKVIITSTGETINDFSSGQSYLWLKIYLVASGAKPRSNCDENDTINNGIYGLNCYMELPEKIYKTEIEKTIKEEVPTIKKLISKDFEEAHKLYKEYTKNKNEDSSHYVFILQNYQQSIKEHEIMFLSQLINITYKYNTIKGKIPETNSADTMLTFLNPYFKKNNVNHRQLEELDKYTNQKVKEINILIQKM